MCYSSQHEPGQNARATDDDCEPDLTAAMFLICSLGMSAIITYLGFVKLWEMFWEWVQ